MKEFSKVSLQLFEATDNDGARCIYLIEHNNGETVLDQAMVIDRVTNNSGWVANIDLGEFPEQGSPRDAALKLADWLKRLSAAIEHGNYEDFKPPEVIDLSVYDEGEA